MSNISTVEIINLALTVIQCENIEDINEDSASANVCRVIYPQTVRSLLSGYFWQFASKEEALALLADEKSVSWKYCYKLPNEMLQANYIEYNRHYEQKPPYEIRYSSKNETTVLFTNKEKAVLNYTVDITTPTIFPLLFIEALKWQLCLQLIKPLNARVSDAKLYLTLFQDTVLQATSMDAKGRRKRHIQINYLKQARLGQRKLNLQPFKYEPEQENTNNEL